MFHGNELSQYDMNIAFIFFNFVQVFLPSMWPTLQYLHLFESMYRAWYIEHGIIFIFKKKVLIWLCNTLANFKRYVIEPKWFLGYPTRGIACALSILKHEQYHSDSLDQNNVAHGVYWIPQAGYWFSCRFW
jgi:hypothetical protein